MATKPSISGRKRSIMINSSRIIPRPDNLEGGEETEIATQISIPHEGGWGWVVVICSLCSSLILDGAVYTFGSMLADMTNDLNVSEALVALVNSIAVALYFIMAPICSALINRFGFRASTMAGSIICSLSLFIVYFSTSFTSLCLFYGVIPGFGYSLINLSCGLVVGFYFEKLRTIAISIASTGSSIGIMSMYPINSHLTNLAGWRIVVLFHSGMFGLIYFLGMTFKPLTSVTILSPNDPTRTVTYLPSLSAVHINTRTKSESLVPTATERLFGAVSNANFPTAANVLEDSVNSKKDQANPSKISLAILNPQNSITNKHFQKVEPAKPGAKKTSIVVPRKSKLKRCCKLFFSWDKHVPESRPLYRDDAFYDGKVEKLPEYQKSKLETVVEGPGLSGLEYRLAVSRAAAASDLNEHRGIFTTAARRVLATMMDPKLLKFKSFLLLCCSGFFCYIGLLVPYVYLNHRNALAGVSSDHCNWFTSAIGFSNIIGRITLGCLAYKIDPIYLFCTSLITGGLATCSSVLSFSIYYQYAYSFVFGFCIACVASLRSMIVVSLYGLENLTSGVGMILFFQGVGSLVSTPMASALKNTFGYDIAFIVAGISITIGGLIVIPIKYLKKREDKNNIARK